MGTFPVCKLAGSGMILQTDDYFEKLVAGAHQRNLESGFIESDRQLTYPVQ